MSDKWIVSFAIVDPNSRVRYNCVSTIDMHPALFFSKKENYGGEVCLTRIYSAIRVPDELSDLPDLSEVEAVF